MIQFARQIILVEADTTVKNFCGTFSRSDISSNKMYSCLTFIKVGGETERNIMILRDGEMTSFEQQWKKKKKNVLEKSLFISGLHEKKILWLFTVSWYTQSALKNSYWTHAEYCRPYPISKSFIAGNKHLTSSEKELNHCRLLFQSATEWIDRRYNVFFFFFLLSNHRYLSPV